MEFPKVGKPLHYELEIGYKGDGVYWYAHIVDSESTGRFEMARHSTQEEALVASVEWVREERHKKLTRKF